MRVIYNLVIKQNKIKSTGVDLSTPVDLSFLVLGRSVKTAREAAGLSQELLGAMIGKSKQQISKIEKGNFSDLERIKSTLILIAQKLNNDLGEDWLRKHLDEKGKTNEAAEQVGAMFQSLGYVPDGDEKQEIWDELKELASKVHKLVRNIK